MIIETRYRVWDIARLGELLGLLQHTNAEDSAREVYEWIQELKAWLDDFQLVESSEMAENWFNMLLEDLEDQLDKNPEAPILDWAKVIREDSANLVAVVRDEANARSVFIVPRDDEGYTEHLLDDPLETLCSEAPPSFRLPEHAVDDFFEAAQCYAIGQPAGAIVFSLRATEALLREFYHEVTGEKPAKRATWGMLTHVLKLPVLSCDNVLKSRLGELQKQRNRAMHAGVRLSHEWDHRAARRILRTCGKTIVEMERDYVRRKSMDAQGF